MIIEYRETWGRAHARSTLSTWEPGMVTLVPMTCIQYLPNKICLSDSLQQWDCTTGLCEPSTWQFNIILCLREVAKLYWISISAHIQNFPCSYQHRSSATASIMAIWHPSVPLWHCMHEYCFSRTMWCVSNNLPVYRKRSNDIQWARNHGHSDWCHTESHGLPDSM